MKIINLTPHPINFAGMGEIPSAGTVKVDEVIEQSRTINGIPVIEKKDEIITGLPSPREGVIYVLSPFAAQVAWRMGRDDVYTTMSVLMRWHVGQDNP